ncbi:MAG: GNAT family N-acetyltransferase [Fibrobacter sp.]|nr:GNAT family N-acetyltransferase [Fibrobacter sp.]
MQDFLDEIPVETLRGERVVLRALTEEDFVPLYAVIDGSREFLSEHLPWPEECHSVEDVAARIDSWDMQAQMGNGACWGIFKKNAGASCDAALEIELAGCIIVGWVQWANRSATLSYWLGKSYTGLGLATEAVKKISKYVFSLGINRLEISAAVNNPASIAVARRAGFVEEGRCREFERINGVFVDHWRLSLLSKDIQIG